MPSTRFGMKASLAKRPNIRQGAQCNPEVIATVFDHYWSQALRTIDTYSESTKAGDVLRCVNPRTVISIDPTGLYFDQICDLVDSIEGQIWFASQFNSLGYRDNIKVAINRASQAWLQGDFNHHYRVDSSGMVILDQRPTQ